MRNARLWMVIICIMLLMLCMCGTAEEIIATGTCGPNVSWTFDSDYLLTISGTGAMDSYTADEYVPWYRYVVVINTVKIDSGVTSIGDYSFFGCDSMTAITIPDSVTSIGGRAFGRCHILSCINLPAGVTSIGQNVFEDCQAKRCCKTGCATATALKNAGINYNPSECPSLTMLGTLLLFCDSGITNLEIPDGVTKINNLAFYGQSSLKSITIPESVTDIGVDVFENCNNPTIYGAAGSKAESYAKANGIPFVAVRFYPKDCMQLPIDLLQIGEEAFMGSTDIEYVIVPASTTAIGSRAFKDCTQLEIIRIPSTVTDIAEDAFAGCSANLVIETDSDDCAAYRFAAAHNIQVDIL